MKTQLLARRGSAAAAVLALSVSLVACSSGESDTAGDSAGTESSSAPAEPSDSASTEPAADEPFGPGCADIPTSGAGSFDGMVSDPVATAAGNNPLLSTLVTAVTAANLGDTLNDAPALTVFAPVNSAFEAVPPATLNPLLKTAGEQGSPLSQILTHHVLGERVEAADIGGEYDTLNGDTLTVEGSPEDGMTVSDGTVTANVACGGIQTGNATVYAIDMVLTGATLAGS